MFILRFQVGRESFAVDLRRIVEVTPQANLRPMPHAPAYLAGLFHYRGRVVPVVDLNRLLGAAPSAARLSTRIILVEPAPGQPFLGLLAERVSDLEEVSERAAATASLSVPEAPYLGAVLDTDSGLVQLLAVEHILPASMGQPLPLSVAEIP